MNCRGYGELPERRGGGLLNKPKSFCWFVFVGKKSSEVEEEKERKRKKEEKNRRKALEDGRARDPLARIAILG